MNPVRTTLSAAALILFLVPPLFAGKSLYEISVPELTVLAEKGNCDAQLALGAAYEFGRGVAPDPAAALGWYRKAAEQGKGLAMRNIGNLYDQGKGVEKDKRKAAEWYLKAIATKTQTLAEYPLVRLSREGFTEKKYGGVQVEGGLAVSILDETTPIGELVGDLPRHTEERETGKSYWIGYNDHMLSIAARGETAIQPLAEFIESAPDARSRDAGLLTLHLLGIGCEVSGRFEEDFKSRKAREAFWRLMKMDGLLDGVARLLKRDPWPADVPAIMDALEAQKSPCPVALNALGRYKISKTPLDSLAALDFAGTEMTFTIPRTFTPADFVSLALEALKKTFPGRVFIEDNAVAAIDSKSLGENPAPHVWKGTSTKLLQEIKDFPPVFDYCQDGRPIFFYTEGQGYEATLHFCGAETAKKRLLEWWRNGGRDWYCR